MSKYSQWHEEVGQTTKIPSKAVFFMDDKDGEGGSNAWRKLFRFCTRVRTFDVDDEGKVKPYPIQWSYIRKLLWNMLYNKRLIVFKVRQILATWSLATLFLWEAMALDNSRSIFVSKGQREAKKFLRERIFYIYERLPANWKTHAHIARKVSDEMEWSNGSAVMAFPSTAVSGRSLTLTRAAADEAGFIKHCRGLVDTLIPAMGGHGKLGLISTPYEVESDFELIVNDADEGVNDFEVLRFPYQMVLRDRGEEYRREVESKLASLSERGKKTEYGLQFAIKEEHALFPTFDSKLHVMSQLELEGRFDTSDNRLRLEITGGREEACPVYMAIDPHSSKPTAMLWMAVLPDGTWYVLDELWHRGYIERSVKIALSKEKKWRIVNRVVDPFANTRQRTLGTKKLSSKIREAGMQGLRTAHRERVGINDIQAKLEVGINNLPGILFSPRCKRTIKQMRVAGTKDDRMVQKGGKYHHVDCLKYIANSRPMYNVREWNQENTELDDRYKGLIKDFRDNVIAAQQGSRAWMPTRLS